MSGIPDPRYQRLADILGTALGVTLVAFCAVLVIRFFFF